MSETDVAITPDDDAERTRLALRQVMTAEGLNMTQVGKLSGIAYGTLSAWVGGTYQGRSDRVASQVQRWMDAHKSKAATRATVPNAPPFQMTASAEAFKGVFAHAQHMVDFGVISGGPGVGKTITARDYRERTPNVWMITAEPCFSTPRSMLDDLAEKLGVTERSSGQRVSREIVRKLSDSGGLLIVDEAQHLSTVTLDQLRTIHDLASVGIVLIGNEAVYSRVEGTARTPAYAQLYSRVGVRLQRPRPQKRDVDVLLDAWGIAEMPVRRLLHTIARKPGALRTLTKCLRMGFMLAAAEAAGEAGDGQPHAGEVKPTDGHVLMAYRQLANVELQEAA